MLTEIAIDTALKRLTSCSTALFWEVLGHMRVPPFVRNRVKAYGGENAVVLRHPLFRPGPPFQDGSYADDAWAVCALREADEEVRRETESLLAEIRAQMRDGDVLELCVPGKMPEPWEAQIRYYSAVGSAVETGKIRDQK
ncbi:MAG: hypothetical protein II979_11810 [Clostridia bacterium]|nr:hypothetical protein [Clostridia bacterium]